MINQTVFGKEFVKLVWPENENYFEPPNIDIQYVTRWQRL